MQCRTPGCEGDATVRERWCEDHAEVYARVRADLESEKDRYRRRSMVRTRAYVNGVSESPDE